MALLRLIWRPSLRLTCEGDVPPHQSDPCSDVISEREDEAEKL